MNWQKKSLILVPTCMIIMMSVTMCLFLLTYKSNNVCTKWRNIKNDATYLALIAIVKARISNLSSPLGHFLLQRLFHDLRY